jgi:hypothetical protein
MQDRSVPRDIDEPEVPDIGVPSIGVDGVDGKPPKDDGSSATEFWYTAVLSRGVRVLMNNLARCVGKLLPGGSTTS